MGADTQMHLLLLRHLSRTQLELHAAGQPARYRGDSFQAYEALRAIPELSLRPTYYGPSLSGQSRVRQLQSARRLLPAATSLLGLAHYIRWHRVQILHATDRPRDALACVMLAAMTGARSLIHVHIKYDAAWRSRGMQWAFRRADRLVGVSRFVAASLIAGGHKPERVDAVLNAIEPANWDPSLSPRAGRESLGVSGDAPLILSVARLFHGKGHAELIRALALVKRRVAGVRLAIVGADYPEGSGTMRALSVLAQELGVAENLIFTGHRSDVAALLAACDVFALPSFEEPFGLVYTEAMAMKRPVVALASGGAPEIIEHGKSGLLSAPADIDSLADNLLALLEDKGLRARLGDYGRRQVESKFYPQRMASDFAALYSRMIG
jgi:glycosyltransferase involved in cell wall biosynthesis